MPLVFKLQSTNVAMKNFSLICRFVLAVTFGLAAILKLRNRERTAKNFVEFGIPEAHTRKLAVALPTIELSIAVALLSPILVITGAFASVLLLAVFTAVIAYQLASGRSPNCGCFGEISSRPITRWTLVRNAWMMATAVIVTAISRPGKLDQATVHLIPRTKFQWLAMVVAVNSVLQVRLLRQFGEIALAMRGHANTQNGLEVGSLAPDFEGQLLSSDASIRLSELTSRGNLLLVFSSVSCGHCAEIYPALQDLSDNNLILIMSGSRKEAQLVTSRISAKHVVWDCEGVIFQAYAVAGTPSAYLVDSNGSIASKLTVGSDPTIQSIKNFVNRQDDVT